MLIKGRTIEAIIFDLDGTIADSLEDLGDSMNRVLCQIGAPQHLYEDYKFFVGKGLKNLVINALPKEHQENDVVNECYKLLLDDYGKNYLVKTKPYEGIPELIDKLYFMDIKMAVLSNKNDEMTRRIVKELCYKSRFEIIMGSMPGIPRKPNPAGALLIAEKLDIKPGNIAFAGDTNNDMQTAVNAGMLPIGVLWGFRTKKELLENGAEILLEQPSDLFAHIT